MKEENKRTHSLKSNSSTTFLCPSKGKLTTPSNTATVVAVVIGGDTNCIFENRTIQHSARGTRRTGGVCTDYNGMSKIGVH